MKTVTGVFPALLRIFMHTTTEIIRTKSVKNREDRYFL